jgi:hypothetical protein
MLRRVYSRGLLRGIYPRNYLSQVQRERQVGGQTLEAWIGQDSARGELTTLTHGITLWRVPPERVQVIEAELWDTGVIFDWRRHS